jgi:hypothetical protein
MAILARPHRQVFHPFAQIFPKAFENVFGHITNICQKTILFMGDGVDILEIVKIQH